MSDAAPPRILVVDDDRSMRRFLMAALRRGGFEVSGASTGEEALAALIGEAADGADALLLDALLPDVRGFDVARRLIATPATARLPICFLTGAVHGRAATEAGIACVVKPATSEQISATLRELLGDPRATADPEARRAAVARVEELLLL